MNKYSQEAFAYQGGNQGCFLEVFIHSNASNSIRFFVDCFACGLDAVGEVYTNIFESETAVTLCAGLIKF